MIFGKSVEDFIKYESKDLTINIVSNFKGNISNTKFINKFPKKYKIESVTQLEITNSKLNTFNTPVNHYLLDVIDKS
jgi:hypothetical protein